MTFLVRPPPLSGESLSSWRQRLGHANGFRLLPLAPGELRRTDPDLFPKTSTTYWLSIHTLQTTADIASLSLRSLDPGLLSFLDGRHHPRWVTPLRYSRKDAAFGVPFCPQCLAEDTIPYFRLEWRLHLRNRCVVHKSLYVDRCPHCGAAPWPGSACTPELFDKRWIPIHLCPYCLGDLRAVATVVDGSACADKMFSRDLLAAVRLNTSLWVSAREYADAMWCMTSIFLRRRTQRIIGRHQDRFAALAVRIAETGTSFLEDLSIDTRDHLVRAGEDLLKDWPETAVAFCADHGLTAEHFYECKSVMPRWFEHDLIYRIRKQTRGITVSDVEAAVAVLRAAGKKISKAAVARQLRVDSGSVLSSMLGRRIVATSTEWHLLLTELEQYSLQSTYRSSSQEVIVRDGCILLFSICSGRTVSEVAEFSISDTSHLYQELDQSVDVGAMKLLKTLLEKYLTLTVERRAQAGPTGMHFLGFRGGKDFSKSTQRLLSRCMRKMDPRLQRTSKVFTSPIGARVTPELANVVYPQKTADRPNASSEI